MIERILLIRSGRLPGGLGAIKPQFSGEVGKIIGNRGGEQLSPRVGQFQLHDDADLIGGRLGAIDQRVWANKSVHHNRSIAVICHHSHDFDVRVWDIGDFEIGKDRFLKRVGQFADDGWAFMKHQRCVDLDDIDVIADLIENASILVIGFHISGENDP